MKENVERVIDGLFDDYLEKFRTEHPIDESFLELYNGYKSVCIKALVGSIDENAKGLLQYVYERKDGILECREHMKKISKKIRIK